MALAKHPVYIAQEAAEHGPGKCFTFGLIVAREHKLISICTWAACVNNARHRLIRTARDNRVLESQFKLAS